MASTINCPHCSVPLKLPDSAAGRTVKCPKCHENFTAQVTEQSESEVVLEEVASPPSPPSAAIPPTTAVSPQGQSATQLQQAAGQAPVLTMPVRQCSRCGYQGYMVKKWDSWVVPVAIIVAIFTVGLGLLILLVPKKHCCPQCGAAFE